MSETETQTTGREVENYNPTISTLHTVLMLFRRSLEAGEIFFSWRNWLSKYDFDNYKEPLKELSKDFSLKASEYDAFMNDYGQIIAATDNKIIEIFSIDSSTHTLEFYEIDGFNRVMQFDALPNEGELNILNNKRSDVNDAFNLTVQANKQFLESVGGACLTYAAGRDATGFYACLLANIQRETSQD